MERDPLVLAALQRYVAGMDRHADREGPDLVRPLRRGQGLLTGDRARNRIPGAGECDDEGVARLLGLIAAMAAELRAERFVVTLEGRPERFPESLPQGC